MRCPRCEQDDVVQTQIRKTGEVLFLCPECEATWFSKDEVGKSPFLDFGTYMEKLGLPPLWEELTLVDSKRQFE